MKNELVQFKKVFRIISDEMPYLFLTCILSYLAMVFFEGLGLTSIVPLLDGIGGGTQDLSNIPFSQYLIEPFRSMNNIDRIKAISFIIFTLAVLRGLFLFIANIFCNLLNQKIYILLKKKAFGKMFEMDYQKFNEYEAGHLFSIVDAFTAEVGVASAALVQISSSFIVFLVYTAMLFYISWKLTLISGVILLCVNYLFKKSIADKIKKIGEKLLNARAILNIYTYNVISAMKLFRLTSRENDCVEKHTKLLQDYWHGYRTQQIYNESVGPGFSTAIAVIISIILFASVYILQGDFGAKMVNMLLFFLILTRLAAPVQSTVQSYSSFLRSIYGLNVITEFLENVGDKNRVMDRGKTIFEKIKSGIRFEDVSFGYENGGKLIAKELNITIPARKITAIVGPSGAGKTTIINLLGRLYDPLVGAIKVDGIDLKDFNIASWRRKIAFVSQETFLFNDTILNNLKFFSKNASNEEVILAAKKACIHDYIMTLPEGYEAMVGERGVKLSGGQQQRMSIARAILSKPDLLILDEATSQLDSIAEQAIQNAMIAHHDNENTIIIIAHRLSTIQKADWIIVLDQGKIVEQGIHEDLLKNSNLYHQLAKLQASPEVV